MPPGVAFDCSIDGIAASAEHAQPDTGMKLLPVAKGAAIAAQSSSRPRPTVDVIDLEYREQRTAAPFAFTAELDDQVPAEFLRSADFPCRARSHFKFCFSCLISISVSRAFWII